jgi:four helix bundle protein
MRSEKLLSLICLTAKSAKMGTIKDFEDLELWKLARKLVMLIYSDFRTCKDFTFRNQITSAGISIMNNISEGFCRRSDAEFRQFLNISKGSAGEVKNMYYIGEDLGFINSLVANERRAEYQKLMNGIGRFMKYLKPKEQTTA